MKPGDTITGPHVECICPFCGVRFYAYESGAVIHRLPVCTKFIALEADDFLAAANDEFQRRLGGLKA